MSREYKGHFPTLRNRVSVIRQTVVCEENLGEILGVTPFEQHPLINPGDLISVCFFHNGSLRNSGTVTIWHNKGLAAIRTYSASLSGQWLEAQRLIVSEEREEGWTVGTLLPEFNCEWILCHMTFRSILNSYYQAGYLIRKPEIWS